MKIVDFDITKDNFIILRDVKTVFHFAANFDISNGVNDPEIDFNVTTLGTYRLLVSMSKNNKILFSLLEVAFMGISKKGLYMKIMAH